jgi:hypothetical protein
MNGIIVVHVTKNSFTDLTVFLRSARSFISVLAGFDEKSGESWGRSGGSAFELTLSGFLEGLPSLVCQDE